MKDSLNRWNLTLHNRLIKSLNRLDIVKFFPVQCDVIPLLLAQHSHPFIKRQDICVSAPTGSGKTLAYALPILNKLISISSHKKRKLRALILLPSRELAVQVYNVFNNLLNEFESIIPEELENRRNNEVAIALAVGHESFEKEQSILVHHEHMLNFEEETHLNCKPTSWDNSIHFNLNNNESLVDILICTPGRLLEHVEQTPGFTLQDLEFIVLDEADRLLSNAYHSWIRTLLQPNHYTNFNHNHEKQVQRLLFSATLTDNPSKLAMLGILHPLLIRSKPIEDENRPYPSHQSSHDDEGDLQIENEFNTTMMDDNMPTHTPVSKDNGTIHYVLPSQLSESKVICETKQKPFLLCCILKETFDTIPAGEGHRGICCRSSTDLVQQKGLCIVFCSSLESTHRLSLLLKIINQQDEVNHQSGQDSYLFGGKVEEMSSMVHVNDRKAIMIELNKQNGSIAVLVASDQMARGMDLSNVKLVINYDPPKFAKVYVHRAGRTARANRAGHCLTLLKIGQVGSFNKMRQLTSGGSNELIKCQLKPITKDKMLPIYNIAMKKMAKIMSSSTNSIEGRPNKRTKVRN